MISLVTSFVFGLTYFSGHALPQLHPLINAKLDPTKIAVLQHTILQVLRYTFYLIKRNKIFLGPKEGITVSTVFVSKAFILCQTESCLRHFAKN